MSKCQICGGEVKSNKLFEGDFDKINVAVTGDYMALEGHKVCLRNVNNLIIIPNRLRINLYVADKDD